MEKFLKIFYLFFTLSILLRDKNWRISQKNQILALGLFAGYSGTIYLINILIFNKNKFSIAVGF